MGSIDNNIANNSILLLKPYFFVLPTYPFNNLDLFGFVQAYSNCNALTLFGKPSTTVAISHGLFLRVRNAPPEIIPLCCRILRFGCTVKPIYVDFGCFTFKDRNK